MAEDLKKTLLKTYATLSIASARKKVYSQKARQDGRQKERHLLQAISEAEAVQARRIFNSLRGQIDLSDNNISTIFNDEIKIIIEELSARLQDAKEDGNDNFTQILSQLVAAERRIISFYDKTTKDLERNSADRYYVCQFCGFISTDKLPEACPICGASPDGFREIQ